MQPSERPWTVEFYVGNALCPPKNADRVVVRGTAKPHFCEWTFKLPEQRLEFERLTLAFQEIWEHGKAYRSREINKLLYVGGVIDL